MNLNEHLSIEILADHAEGLLGDADSTSVSEHLASCADCSAEATLLMSVGELLAADDPGPMPAHFAARIDVALADLAAAEPVTPKQTTSSPEGAVVIDLASRRRFSGASRVTSVAASLVLLIGGAALGAQVINSDDTSDPGLGALDTPTEEPTDSARPDAKALYKLTAVPKNAKAGKAGSKIDKTGKVYLPNGTQIFPDGTRVIPAKNKGDEPKIVINTIPKFRGPAATFRKPSDTQATVQPSTEPSVTASSPAESSKPAVSPDATAKAPPNTIAGTNDAYVTTSGSTYNEKNFATKVMELLQESGNFGSPDQTISEQSTGNSSPSATTTTDQPRVAAGAVRADNTTSDRGPATAATQAQVRRCANQLNLPGQVLAGDVGTWKGEDATIVVVQNPDDVGGVIGYAVAGDCSKDDPATPDQVRWEQKVDKPGTPAEETPAPSEDATTKSTEQ